ncbi:MAG: hypothetical protein RJA94_1017 [Pseudomonadota bacterium]|jgi:hypothetical protein
MRSRSRRGDNSGLLSHEAELIYDRSYPQPGKTTRHDTRTHMKLLRWLLDRDNMSVSARDIQQYRPAALREWSAMQKEEAATVATVGSLLP